MAFNPIGLATGLAGAALPLGAAALGIGKNTTNVTDFGRTSQYNRNSFQYGGREGAADETANRFSGLASAAQNRGAAQADYGQANMYGAQAQDARSGQASLAGLMMGRATGAVPSLAQLQGDRAMQQATASQASAAASARGAAGLALAGQNAANNTATMQGAISNQTQQNVLVERERAEQAAYGAYSGMRGGDQASMGLASQMAQYNAMLQAQKQQQNDAYSLGLYGQENNVRQQQLTGGMANQQLLGTTMMQGQHQRIGVGEYNADREFDYYKQFGQGLTGTMSGQMMPGAGGGDPKIPAPSATGLAPGMGGAPPNPNAVGIPQPGTSDDRAKFAMSPLSMLGLGGGGSSSPGATVDMGGKGYMSSGDIQQASTGLAGGGGGMPGMVGGGGVTGGNMGDLGMPGGGGGMSGGFLSDDKAKLRAVYLQGRADAGDEESAYPGLAANEELIVGRDGAHIRAGFAGARTNGAGLTDREIRAREIDPRYDTSEGVGPFGFYEKGPGGLPVPPVISGGAGLIDLGRAAAARHLGSEVTREMQGSGTVRDRFDPTDAAGGSRIAGGGDPVTRQFAQGLAPIRFEYRPGMGPAGQQTGVRAQQAETQPLTASMITRRPDGLRQIDPAMGLSTALAGVGHLAQKQQRLEDLLTASARREGY